MELEKLMVYATPNRLSWGPPGSDELASYHGPSTALALRNGSLREIPSVHPASGGIYCDTCPPSEFAETAANQSARFLGTARQPEAGSPKPWARRRALTLAAPSSATRRRERRQPAWAPPPRRSLQRPRGGRGVAHRPSA